MTTRMNVIYSFVAVVLLIGLGWGLYRVGFFGIFSSSNINPNAISLSAVVLIGLALVVVLMVALGIVYSVLGLADKNQALALPEGSIRALIAFSLVLIFVCMAAFLYGSVNSVELTPGAKPLTKITEAQLNDLKTQFVVAYEQARDADGNGVMDADKKGPLYNATYFSKRSKDADDFAKQIFTTLATVFVSVISFYFGSSVTSSAVGAGAKAVRDGGDGGKKGDDSQSVLADAQAAAHAAQLAVDRAADAVTKAKSLVETAPEDKKSVAGSDATAAQKGLDGMAQIPLQARQQVEAARKAVEDAAAPGTDSAKVTAAAAGAINAREAAKQLADKAKQSADKIEGLLNKIKSDTGQS